MILLTGASGGLGRATLEHLLVRVPRDQLVVTARHPDKLRDVAARGVEIRRCDYDDPDSIRSALVGAERFYFVPSHDTDERRLSQNMTVIDVAGELEIPHVYYASQANATIDAPLGVYRVHAATEDYLKKSGLTWTMLRNGYYMEDIVPLVGDALQTGVISKPLDGPIPYVSRREYGEAHAILLAEGGHAGETLNLTNLSAWDLTQIADLMSRFLRRQVGREVINDEDFAHQLRADGVPDEWVVWRIEAFKQSRRDGVAETWPTLQQVLQRDPLSLETHLVELLARASIAGNNAVASATA
jgi:NAD(P)H dehydrogenase (quinone)